jgi:squalene-hopene/tetraprenyl-beta-curcumene cyclase
MTMTIRLAVAFTAALVAMPFGAVFLPSGPADWKKEDAGKYLDLRAKAWFEFGSASRGEGPTRSSCLCCHTLVPYALSRPALRRTVGDEKRTEFENRLLAQTKMRVENWTNIDTAQYQLLYDFSDQKKKESWGTESVLAALILAFDDNCHGLATPEPTTMKAFENLWHHQTADGAQKGSWDWLDFGFDPWESKGARYYGASLAAIAVGTAPGYHNRALDSEEVAKVTLLRNYLKDNFQAQHLYNQVWALWASTALHDVLTAEQREELSKQLRAKQRDDGGWSLSSLGTFIRKDGTPQETASDGYATGLILHVLQSAGIGGNDLTIAKGLAWLRIDQEANGEWKAFSLNKKRDLKTHVGKFMADAATAYSVLALTH